MSNNLIIGGTHGLGAEIATALKQEGEQTYVVGRSYNENEHGKGQIVDLADPGDVSQFVEEIAQIPFKSFYFVAGYGYKGDFANQADVLQMMQVNLVGGVLLCQAAWRSLLASDKPGNIVIVSSTTGKRIRDDETTYAVTKHGLVALAESLGKESERLNAKVRVLSAVPGGMKTPFWDGARPDGFDVFLDPAKVAQRIVTQSKYQSKPFVEEIIERGSL